MQLRNRPHSDVERLVSACRKTLWRKRMLTTSGGWLLVPAAGTAALALVHRAATSLSPGWTLPVAAVLVIATLTGRLVSTRPTLQHSLLEADRIAGTDALMLSAWPLIDSNDAAAVWSVDQVRHAAQSAARDGYTTLSDTPPPQPGLFPRVAAAVLAAAVLVLALPGKAPGIGSAAMPTAIAAAGGPATGEPEPAERAPAGNSAARSSASGAAIEKQPQPARQFSEGDARVRNTASGQSLQGGNAPAATRGQTPAAPVPAAGGLQAIEQVDIRRRGPRTAAVPGVASEDEHTAAGDHAQAIAAQGEQSEPAPPVEADFLMRHYLSNWQRNLETTQ